MKNKIKQVGQYIVARETSQLINNNLNKIKTSNIVKGIVLTGTGMLLQKTNLKKIGSFVELNGLITIADVAIKNFSNMLKIK
jgi:hypothetical protein